MFDFVQVVIVIFVQVQQWIEIVGCNVVNVMVFVYKWQIVFVVLVVVGVEWLDVLLVVIVVDFCLGKLVEMGNFYDFVFGGGGFFVVVDEGGVCFMCVGCFM